MMRPGGSNPLGTISGISIASGNVQILPGMKVYLGNLTQRERYFLF